MLLQDDLVKMCHLAQGFGFQKKKKRIEQEKRRQKEATGADECNMIYGKLFTSTYLRKELSQ